MNRFQAEGLRGPVKAWCLLAATGIAVAAGSVRAQDCFFTNIPVSNGTIANESAVAYDTVRDRMLLVENVSSLPHLRLRAWTGTEWTTLSTDGPTRRTAWAMAFDSTRDRLVLYGGFDSQCIHILPLEVWEWDGAAWTSILPIEPEFGRSQHAMAYHAGLGKVVMFGGDYYSSATNEAAVWDGTTWGGLPALIPVPPERRRPQLAYDSGRNRLMLYGGTAADNSVLGDLWEYDGVAWIQRIAPGPEPRVLPAFCYDPTRSRLLLMGGGQSPSAVGVDAWEFDGVLGQWNLRAVFGSTEGFAGGRTAVFNAIHGRIVGANGMAFTQWNGNGSVTPPWIMDQPVGGQWTSGVSVTLSVVLGGTGPRTFQWRKDGRSLVNGGQLSGVDTAFLVLNPVSAADAGAYDVVISNSCGQVASEPVVVTIAEGGCYANCDHSAAHPILNVNDFQCFLNRYAAGDSWANCDGTTNVPMLNVNDFQCFLNAFAAGCR